MIAIPSLSSPEESASGFRVSVFKALVADFSPETGETDSASKVFETGPELKLPISSSTKAGAVGELEREFGLDFEDP